MNEKERLPRRGSWRRWNMEAEPLPQRYAAPRAGWSGYGAGLAAPGGTMRQVNDGKRAREEIAKLMDRFPQLRAEDVPEEVWERARMGGELTVEYCLWRMAQLEEMLARRERNFALSTGSMSSMDEPLEGVTLAAFWDAYEV